MLCKPKSFYDEKHKVAIGYKNPLCLARAKQAQSALYNGHVLVTTNHTPTVIHDSEDTRELAEITRNRMLLKMQSPLYDNNRKKAETLAPKPISALTVYPPNTPVKLVPRILPTKSQVKINLYNLEHQIQEKDNVIRHLKDLVANVNDRSHEPYNAIDATALIEQNDCDRVELEKVKQHYKELYDSIKIMRAHTSEKTSTMLNEIENHECGVVNILNSVNATSTVTTVLNKGKQIWKPKGTLSDNSLYKTKRVWKATGKLFADIGYQWRPTGKKLTLGKLNCGSQWRPTGKKFALGEMCHLTKLSVKCSTLYANQKDPNKNWGTEIPNSPNSTVSNRSNRSPCCWYLDSGFPNIMTWESFKAHELLWKVHRAVRFRR
ncbi:hypothetical protein Tco_1146339 [Tanacetum coccineum]